MLRTAPALLVCAGLLLLGCRSVSAAIPASCGGSVVYTSADGTTFLALQLQTMNVSTFLDPGVPTGLRLGAFLFSGSSLYYSIATNSSFATHYQYDLVHDKVVGVVESEPCMDFAVDAQLLGNKVLCLLAMNVHGPGVSILDFQHNAAKLVAYMPSTSLYNDQWAYNSKTKVYYCEVGVNERAVLMGMDVRTGAIVSQPYLPSPGLFGGPMAIDPLSHQAYFISNNNYPNSQLATYDLPTGNVTLSGVNIAGGWSQGLVGATISSYDRCDLLFARMYRPGGSEGVWVLAMVDMDSGELVASVDGVNGWSLGYYRS